MVRYWLGVDPGITGALAIYDAVGDGVITVYDMPVFEMAGKTRLDHFGLHDILLDVISTVGQQTGKITIAAVLEDVHAMPKQGVSATFNFGATFGATRQAIVSAGVRHFLVPPATWKKAMRVTADKDSSRARVSQFFPKEAHRWSRKKDDGRAEALLLAMYGAKFLTV